VVVPLKDTGYAWDRVYVLAGLGGSVARWMHDDNLAHLEAPPFELVHPQSLTPTLRNDLDAFERRCNGLHDQAKARLAEVLAKTSAERCAQLAVVLGQLDLKMGAIGGGPNPFAPELELIANTATSKRRRWPGLYRSSTTGALEAVKLARRCNVYRDLALHASVMQGDPAEPRWPVGPMFETEWHFMHSKFSTPFDYRYLSKLVERLQSQGVIVPGPSRVLHILESFLRAWAKRITQLVRELPTPGVVHTVLATQSLLDPELPDLGHLEREVLKRYLPRFSLTKDEIVAGTNAREKAEVLQWLNALTQTTADQSGTHVRTDRSSLRDFPIISGSDGYLLALTHRLSGDLSALTDEKWGRIHGERYYSTRAAIVEELSLATISEVLGGAQIHQATYEGADGKTHGEVDGVVTWHDVCVVLEGKGGYLSQAARRGSSEAAVSDMKGTVGHGYFQAARLIRIVSRDGSALLRGSNGKNLVLDGRRLRRAYVIIPTADDYSIVGTKLTHLWDNKVLPPGAVPLVISVQALLALTEVLGSATEFVSYLDYREEVLKNNWITMVDEQEILGAFVGGVDIIGGSIYELRNQGITDDFRSRYSRHRVTPAPMQEERHLQPWFMRKYGKTVRGDPLVEAPRRHSGRVAEEIGRLWDGDHDLMAHSAATAIDPDVLEYILGTSKPPRTKEPVVRIHHNIAAIDVHSSQMIGQAREQPAAKSAIGRSRYVVFVTHSAGMTRLAHAQRGKRHACYYLRGANFAIRSLVPVHDPWFTDFERRRRRSFDTAAVSALEDEGVPRDLAIGVVRANIVEQVRELANCDVPITRAVTLWLGPIKNACDQLGLAAQDLGIEPPKLRDVSNMIDRGDLPMQHTAAMIVAMKHSDKPIREIAAANDLLVVSDDERLVSVVRQIVVEHADAVAKLHAGHREVMNFLIGQVIRTLGRRPRIEIVRLMLEEAVKASASSADSVRSRDSNPVSG
jgi:hypothetical protein